MSRAEEIIKSVLSDKKLASSKVYRDEPLIFTASKMKNYTPAEYGEMKKLISGRDSVFMPANQIFYIQGKYMESFTDSFDYQGEFVRYFPTYRDLSTSQLRGYFSWRTKLRQENIQKAPIPFAFIYMYELINLIGVSSPEDGFLKLKDFSQRYGELDRRILAYSKTWLCDFAAYYGISHEAALSLPAFGNDEALICLMKHREMPPEKIIAALEAFSSYKITKSSFYKKNADAVTDKELVYHVIEGADEHRDDARNRKTPQKSADRFRAERIFGRFHRGYLLSNEVKVHRLYRVNIPGKTPRLYSIP